VQIKPLAFLATALLLVAYILHSGVGSNPLVRQGSKAPEFTLKTLDGKEVSLSDFRGSVVFLNFWRTDCAPCVAEMPDMEIVQRTFKGRKFQMMPVSLDMEPGDVAFFYEERGLTMPAYLDPGQNVAARYDILGTPETFVIGPDGIVLKYSIGPQPWASQKMLAQLDRLIP
jgi:peroxiredoxin